jgi:hypothetical protein
MRESKQSSICLIRTRKISVLSVPSVVNYEFMKREQVVDLYFMEARAKLIDLAAFLDRVDRAPGTDDFRVTALRTALQELPVNQPDRAKRVLLSLSDPTTDPLPAATTKGACGAWPGSK